MALQLVIGNKNYSSWSLRAWLILAEKGIAFDELRIPLDTPGYQEQIEQYSQARCVPVLLIDGVAVWDSLAIAETVAERYPQAQLWPVDATQRAHARSVSGFAALRSAMPMNSRALGRKVPLVDALTRDIDRVLDIWSDCHRQYGGDWLFGDFSIADAMFAPVVLRLRTYGINLPESASHYPARLLQSAAMQNWLLDAESETEVIEAGEVGQ